MNANQAIFANLVESGAAASAAAELLTFVDIDSQGAFSEQRRNYRELWDNGQRVAAGLRSLGLKAGEHFAVLMQNHPEFVESMVASSVLGSVFVPMDPRARGERLAYMLDFADCSGVVVADYALDSVLAVQAQLPKLRWIAVVATGMLQDLPESAVTLRWLSALMPAHNPGLAVEVTDAETTMQLLFTSGTTGNPKGLEVSYARYDRVISMGPDFGIGETDRLYTGLSLTHANAQMITLGVALKQGLPSVISRRFSKSRLWEILRRYRCTVFNLLGGMTTAIYSEPPRPDDRDNPVRMVLSGGMPAAIWEDFEQRFDLRVFEIYGASEGGNTFNPPGVGPVGSIGKPPAGLEVAILDEDGRECAPGVSGEMVFRNADGSCNPVSYYKNPEASEAKTAGGWLRMGDIGHKDEDGWVFFDYRSGGGIRHNGDFVSPAFVEKVLAEHELVDDVFVYGVEAKSGVPGEKDVVAAIVLRAGAAQNAVETIFAYCRAELDNNSVPGYLQIMTAIPKTASEKPQERFCLEAFHAGADSVYTECEMA